MRFLAGDEQGSIKSVSYSPNIPPGEPKTAITTLYSGTSHAVQVLAVGPILGQSQFVAAGFSDGSGTVFNLETGNTLAGVHNWKETRLRNGHRYIGLMTSEKGIYSCTSNGALRFIPFDDESKLTTTRLSSLPTSLQDWRMSPDQGTFAYGGDEVHLSVWDTERAFSPRPQNTENGVSKKRKRNEPLFPGELWRAKNINDHLGLRQPVCITSLTYLDLGASLAGHQLIAGTQLGYLHRYDTRAARRPVSDWKVAKVGGVEKVEKGISEHEVFASDNGYNLSALDVRNGRIIYSYKGLSGSVTSIAPSPDGLVSTALDHYIRIHNTFPPPTKPGGQQERKGEVLDKVFMKSTPTVVAWDRGPSSNDPYSSINHEDDSFWETAEKAEDGEM